MYLPDHALRDAISDGSLIIDPAPDPAKIGLNHIDVHLDSVDEAKVWNSQAIREHHQQHGLDGLQLRITECRYIEVSNRYLAPPARGSQLADEDRVFRREDEIIIRPRGFVLWKTRERIGTPEENANYVCFIDGRSTKTARTGLLVHITAPTIHAGWSGKVTLEMVNLGPFDIVLREGDPVAQLLVARLSSPPSKPKRGLALRRLAFPIHPTIRPLPGHPSAEHVSTGADGVALNGRDPSVDPIEWMKERPPRSAQSLLGFAWWSPFMGLDRDSLRPLGRLAPRLASLFCHRHHLPSWASPG